jgi:DNA-binding MarR family transcriptional regulator
MPGSELKLTEFLPYQLSVTSNAVSDLIARSYHGRFGLKIPEWRLMAILGEHASLTQREMVAATALDKVMVNRATAALATRGLIERAPNAADGRSHHLMLSITGRELYEQIVPEALAIRDQLAEALGKDELTLLDKILGKLRHRAEQIKDKQ